MEHDPFWDNLDSLEEFADAVSEFLHCPITIEDRNHRLLAYSTHDERTDPARVSTIIGRRVPEKVINSLWKEGVIPSLLNSREPVRVKKLDDIGLGDRIAISIWNKDEVLGFIWALEIDQKLDDDDFAFLKRAQAALKNKLLPMQARKDKKEERSQELFWKLLTSHYGTNEAVIQNFLRLQINPSDTFALAVFQFQNDISSQEEKQIMYLLKIHQRLKILLYTVDHQKLILLISLDQLDQPLTTLSEFVQTFVAKMEERFGVGQITPSFSSLHQDYLQVEKAYKEALSVISMKEKFPREMKEIFGYQNLGIYQFIDVLLEKRTKDGFKNHALVKLHEYDDKHHSDLVLTLETFLDKDSNVNEAAKALNVHVNTLNYRLKRIAEIGEINMKDPNQKTTLYIDLKLEHFKRI
ncbi:MAG: PucR family transcriptional regulator [Tuberibacillus sp.]